MGKLSLKDEAWVQVDAMTEAVSGEVSLISPIIELSKRSAKVEITIDNDKMGIKPGMFAQVEIPVAIYSNAILIPRSAVTSLSAKTGTVFVVQNGIGKRRQVELGFSQEDAIVVTLGLAEGESVVTAGQHSLQDGEKVAVVTRGE